MTEISAPLEATGSRRYPKAPIVEAVLEFRVTTPKGLTPKDLRNVLDDAAFARHEAVRNVSGRIEIDPSGVSAKTSQEDVGHLWVTVDGGVHVQARPDAFLFSKRAPYSDWNEFTQQAERLWLKYRAIAVPETLDRIGVRYVNRIDIPLAPVELKDYFFTTAEVPPDLPQVLSEYFLSLQLPEVEPGITATIISALVPPDSASQTSVILDIDTWCMPGLRADDALDTSVRTWLKRLRKAKNLVFEACITQKTRGLFY